MPPAEPGTVSTRLLEGRIIETLYRGHMRVDMGDEVLKSLERLLPRHRGADWLIDVSDASGFTPLPRPVTEAIFDAFNKNAGRRIAVVMTGSAFRMMGTTFAFAFRLPMKMFDTRDAALAHLRAEP